MTTSFDSSMKYTTDFPILGDSFLNHCHQVWQNCRNTLVVSPKKKGLSLREKQLIKLKQYLIEFWNNHLKEIGDSRGDRYTKYIEKHAQAFIDG